MIKINNLIKKYNEGTPSEELILNKCSLDIIEGEKIIIVGESGAGKTTLLRIIGLSDKKYSGSYLIDNTDISGMSAKKIARLRNEKFGFIFQNYNLLGEETAYNNILIPLIYSEKYKRSERKERINNISEILEIQSVLDRQVKFLSGGEKQRIAIARAIVNDPEIIIMDEPTNALNLRMKTKALNYIESLVGDNKNLIFVSHDYNIINNFNYTCYILDDGQLIKQTH